MMYGLQMNSPRLSVWGPQLYFIQFFFFKTIRAARVNLSLKFDGLPFKFRWVQFLFSWVGSIQFHTILPFSSSFCGFMLTSTRLQLYNFLHPNCVYNSSTIWMHNEEEEILRILVNTSNISLLIKILECSYQKVEIILTEVLLILRLGYLERKDNRRCFLIWPVAYVLQSATTAMQYVHHGVQCPCEWQWPSVRHSIDGKTKQSTYAPLPCLL